MKPIVLTAAFVLVATTPAFAQSSMPNMPGMQHPQTHVPPPSPPPSPPPPPPPPARRTAPAPAPSPTTQPEHDMNAMPGMAHDPQTPAANAATTPGPAVEEPVGNQPPPPAPTDHAAEQFYDREIMEASRAQLRREHGGAIISKVMLNLGEVAFGEGDSGYRWEGEGWIGGDINRFVFKTEGEASDGGVEAAEMQALYSRAIGPYFDLQVGLRHDIEPSPNRTYAVLGFEGVAPYWFETAGAVFISNEGEVRARLEGAYDARLTQRLILQPRAEINLAAEDIPELGVGAGVTDVEFGLRLRYEIRRKFAPYIGVSYQSRLGDTADLAEAAGEDASDTRFVVGVRAWF